MKIFVQNIISTGLKAVFMLCFCATASGCEKKTVVSDSVKSILFIGNSLTYSNDLPAMVVALAKEKGIELKTETLAFPNYGLEDHWNIGSLQQLIASKTFDFVILQQGPSSQSEGRAMLLDYGARIKALCDNTKTRVAFFMVWPAFANIHTFDGVIKNYSDAASATNSLLCPVGAVWKKHFEDTKDYSYYGPDLFHPSQKGTKIAAEVIVEALFK
ncbi:MAG TPA: SGNH/GDSL hydrolase family protein [Ignavibacteriaceae bacterium]